MLLTGVAACALLAWLVVLALPWQPHRTRERLDLGGRREPTGSGAVVSALDSHDLSDVTVLIPARDESELIGRAIAALRRQGSALDVIVIDDQSADGTADVCA